MSDKVNDRSLRRTRSLSTLGKLRYDETVEVYVSKLRQIKHEIDNIYTNVQTKVVSLGSVRGIQDQLYFHLTEYEQLHAKYCVYLQAQRTTESTQEEAAQRLLIAALRSKVDSAVELLHSKTPSKNPSRTHSKIGSSYRSLHTASHRSLRSSSRLSEVLLQHSTRLATAKARFKYAEEEGTLMKQQAALDASKMMLKVKRELDEAKCNLEAVYDNISDHDGNKLPPCDVNTVTANPLEPVIIQRTASYVADMNSRASSQRLDVNSHPLSNHAQQPLNVNAEPFKPSFPTRNPLIDTDSTRAGVKRSPDKDSQHFNMNTKTLNVSSEQADMCTEFAKVFAKKDLITKKHIFDDNPQNFATWKASFKNAVRELDLSHMEEMDLLIQWLGETSSARQAKSIRNANAANPKRGLERIWERLHDLFANPEIVESAIKDKLAKFPKLSNKDNAKLYELYDLVTEIESLKEDKTYSTLLGYYDSSSGVNPIVAKLPFNIQEKWVTEATNYKRRTGLAFPTFPVFASFLGKITKMRNDPSLQFDTLQDSTKVPTKPRQKFGSSVTAHKTEVVSNGPKRENTPSENKCPIHTQSKHTLNECRSFRLKSLDERRQYVRENGYCFRCCGPKKHRRSQCHETVECVICHSTNHPTALHAGPETVPPSEKHEGESMPLVNAKCTQICGNPSHTSKSCAKIVKALVYPCGHRDRARYIYCMIDDQSSHTLAISNFFDSFYENGPDHEYTLVSCSGESKNSGRKVCGYMIESIDNSQIFELPTILECNAIPQNRNEIPVREIAANHPHLHDIVNHIPILDDDIDIELLIGRDITDVHIVIDQRVSDHVGAPFAQLLPLGWVIIGNVCLGNVHHHPVVNVNKTSILANGRPSYMEPCDSSFCVKDDPVFNKSSCDETLGLSIEDQSFLDIMDSGFRMSENGKWTAPLPFRVNKPILQNNRESALKRALSFDASLKHNSLKATHTCEFMQRILDRHHADPAPSADDNKEKWYLPLFSVYHPKKPDSIRVVFDSSAKFHGASLNDVLLKGPPLYNSLLGILLRFRKEAVAVTADVEQMFHNFHVHEEHRDYLRFLWHEENDITKPLMDYRMTVHVFGNSPSPAVATYGLRKAVQNADPDIQNFVHHNFYVDDGLLSCCTYEKAVDLIKRTQLALQENGKLRLHKFASNDRRVLDSFLPDDLAKDLRNLDLCNDTLPMQRSLGLLWDIDTDQFTFRTSRDIKPFTKRGVLSVINGLYDPVGFAAPVVLRGKILMKDMLSSTTSQSWDEPLPDSFKEPWTCWVQSLSELENVHIPRPYSHYSFAQSDNRVVHVFCDASKDAIGAVAYLQLSDSENSEPTISFLLGKSKIAPSGGNTIPRMELCAAVLGVELADIIREQLNTHPNCCRFYTDSQVVLGYISNTSRRFYVYVTNRVNRIRSSTSPSQWTYISTEHNPADLATRSVDANDLSNSIWLTGPPPTLLRDVASPHQFPLVDPQTDQEVRPEVTCDKTYVTDISSVNVNIGTERFTRFSTWESAARGIAMLKLFLRKRANNVEGVSTSTQIYEESELFLIQTVQNETFGDVIQSIREGHPLRRGHPLLPLSPIVDESGLLRVGGRLSKLKTLGSVGNTAQHPLIMPKNHHISRLLVRKFHHQVSHQGRHLTEGAIRAGGFWIVGVKRLVRSEISACVTCRKLRGSLGWHKMADLPEDRLEPSPPFSYVGVDTFGPWLISQRRTRGGTVNQKRWVLMFTCLVTRAVHLEVIEELSSASFINALRRFVALRGPVIQFRSDRGTNFIGATNELNIRADFVENPLVDKYLKETHMTWLFNPPHASHYGGVWERMIGASRRILDSLLLNHKGTLTHEVLTTFLMEVSAIINARPLVPVSTDPETPQVLSPSLLIHQKSPDQHFVMPEFGSKDAIRNSWKCVQYMADLFWQRWRTEYLHSLQVRHKWTTEGAQFKKGNVVLLRDDSLARNQWPMAVVTETFDSDDGRVRKVKIYCGRNGTSYVRPINQLCRLVEVQ